MQAATPSFDAIDPAPKPRASRWREKRQDIEQRSRDKRKATIESMRTQVEVLESVLEAVPLALLEEEFISEDELLSDQSDSTTGTQASGDLPRVTRDFVRRSMILTDEAKQLTDANTELRRWVKEREMLAHLLRDRTRNMVVDDWPESMRRWSRVSRAVFTPWTAEACQEVMDESMREIRRFSFADGDFESTGLTFFGWRDRRKLDVLKGTMKVSLTRTYENHDAETIARGWWELLQSPAKYAQAMLGPNVKWYYEVIQHVTPDIFIIRLAEQYPDSPYQIHQLCLIARLRLRDGYIQIHRSIQSPELEVAINDETAIWTSNFHWLKHDIKQRNDNGECIRVKTAANGTFAASTVEYANRWMRELAISLVRVDTTILGQKLLL